MNLLMNHYENILKLILNDNYLYYNTLQHHLPKLYIVIIILND